MSSPVLAQLIEETTPTIGALHLVLRMDLAAVDDVALAAAEHLDGSADAEAMLTIALATGRDRVDVLEELAMHEPTARDEAAVRLALLETTVQQDYNEFDIHNIWHRFGSPEDMERAASLDPSAYGSSHKGLVAETLEVRDSLRSLLADSDPEQERPAPG